MTLSKDNVRTDRRPWRRRGPVVFIMLGTAAGLFALGRATWIDARAYGLTGSLTDVPVSGSDAAPVGTAFALVAIAAACTCAIGQRRLAVSSASVVALAGLGTLVAIIGVLSDPSSTAAGAVSHTTGVLGGDVRAHTTPYAYGAVATALVLTVAGLAGVRVSLTLPVRAAATKYTRAELPESDVNSSEASGSLDTVAAWDALTRGTDPTA